MTERTANTPASRGASGGSARRARVYFSNDETDNGFRDGLALIDGPWLHFLDEDGEGPWESWPATAIICVEWTT